MNIPRFSRRDARAALLALLVAGTVAALAVLVVVSVGGASIEANEPHGWLTYQFLHFTFKRAVASGSREAVAPQDLNSPGRIELGGQQFHLVCSNCHGGPGIGQSPVALSMRPRPQSLPAVVGQFTDAELFWIVKHGVKFSAMPSWPEQGRDDEVWSMVAFLRKLPTMKPDDYQKLIMGPTTASDPAPIVLEGPIALRDSDLGRNTPPKDEYLYATPAVGFGDQGLATNAVAVCSRCHGADGTGTPTQGEAPNLTVHDAAYLRAALEAYATGDRRSGYMRPVAAQLSPGQIDALAAYYDGLPEKTGKPGPHDPALVTRGETIALAGLTQRAIPACAMCHDGAARAKLGAPRLAGQSEAYLRHQLEAMRDGERGSTRAAAGWNPMPAVAHYLSDSDIASVSAYYAGRAIESAPATASEALPLADATAGKALFAERCVECHGRDARGNAAADIPKLTIQTQAHLAQAMREYRSGARANVKMRFSVQDLGDQAIDGLAAYVGNLGPGSADNRPVDQAAVARGAGIARNGIAERGVPACLGCHGAEMTGSVALIPGLGGQHARYLSGKLADFAATPPDAENALNPMPSIARGLTNDEMIDLGAFFAAQPPANDAAIHASQ